MTFCRSLPNSAEKFVKVVRQPAAVHAQRLEFVQQLHRRGLADLAIRVADDGDFLAALDRARQRERPHGAAQRLGDDVARVAQPDELFGGQRQRVREKRIQARVNARQRDDRQRVRELRRMQSGAGVTGHRPVVRINDGFKEAHKVYLICLAVWGRRQIIFAGDDFASGFCLQFQPGFFGDASAGLWRQLYFPPCRWPFTLSAICRVDNSASAVKINSASLM